MASEIEQLAHEVRRRRAPVRIDEDKLAEIFMHRLDQAMDQKVDEKIDESVKRMDGALRAREDRMEVLGAKDLDKTLAVMEKAIETLQQAEKTAKKVRWGAGRVAAVLMPGATLLLVLALVLWPAAEVLGITPLMTWIWDGFADSEGVWTRTWFALLGIASSVGLLYVLFMGTRKLIEVYDGMRK